MNALGFIDLYCERTAAGFWNEPLNALSNIAFPIAAYFAWRIAMRRSRIDPAEVFVIALAATIGLGSFLFHTFASAWAEVADVIPIWSFVAVFIALVIYRSTGENIGKTIRIAAVAAVITASVFWFTSDQVVTDGAKSPDRFNGSLQYAPALIALVIFSMITQIRQHPARTYILFATVIFLLSLTMRTIDLATCTTTGIGTHFLWHMFNGVMVGTLLLALVRKFPPGGGQAD